MACRIATRDARLNKTPNPAMIKSASSRQESLHWLLIVEQRVHLLTLQPRAAARRSIDRSWVSRLLVTASG